MNPIILIIIAIALAWFHGYGRGRRAGRSELRTLAQSVMAFMTRQGK